jgi:hypothetical protein
MDRERCLLLAKECVCGEREQDYGTPEKNFRQIAALWAAYTGHSYTPVDVAMMMALLKVARIKSGTGTEDSFVDLAGYAACGAEASQAMEETNRCKWKTNETNLMKQCNFCDGTLVMAARPNIWSTSLIYFSLKTGKLVIETESSRRADAEHQKYEIEIEYCPLCGRKIRITEDREAETEKQRHGQGGQTKHEIKSNSQPAGSAI